MSESINHSQRQASSGHVKGERTKDGGGRRRSAGAGGRAAAILGLAAAAATTAVVGAARADVSTNTKGPVQQGQSDGGTGNPALNNPAETISFSGAVSFATYVQSGAISLLSPGTSIVLHNGAGGAPVTYYAPANAATSVQLASSNFNVVDTGVGGTSIATAPVTQNLSALRLEWHQVGSVDGVTELVNDQVGYAGGIGGTPLYTPGTRGPTSANAIFVNTNKYTSSGVSGSSFGLTLNGASSGYNTYDPNNYVQATGQNKLGGVNRVQFAVAENTSEEVSVAGTPSPFAKPNSAGYGKGNPLLTTGGAPANIGAANGRQQLNDVSILNLDTSKIDPQTGSNYAAGAWNAGGTNNLRVEPIAVDAVTISANPGTGLQRLNRGDLQWLQTASRLQNGATFNFAERDVNAGQRVVPALNSGIDPSWAVGINDGGNSNGTNAAAQHSIGPDLRFSGKTTGAEIRTTIAQNRAAIGVVSISEARGAVASAPIRALDLDFTDQGDPTDGSGNTDASKFVRIGYDTIASGQYQFFRNINVVTVKAPDAAWGTANPNIKGDNQGDVRAFINNVKNTVSAYPNLSASIANPADGLLAGGYLLPSLMSKERDIDGGPLYDTGVDADPTRKQLQQDVGSAYGANFTTTGTNADVNSTTGSSATYGALGTAAAVNGSVPITAKNYLLGNFNQNGVRDFAAVKEAVNAAVSLHHADGASNNLFTGVANSTVVSSVSGGGGGAWSSNGANTKGDLIVLGDYNGDGAFDGKDLYALAAGASLADSTATASLTVSAARPFADRVRDTSAVLRKNAALDYVASQLSDPNDADQLFLRKSAESPAAQANDAANHYLNAFNKFDVNRDGLVSRNDAAVVDKFVGADKTSLAQQLLATVNADGSANAGGTQVPVSLYQVGLIDGRNVISTGRYTLAGSASNPTVTVTTAGDFALIRQALGAHLQAGDTKFRGQVDSTDVNQIVQRGHYNDVTSNNRWSDGDFTGDGVVNSQDINAIVQAGFYNKGNYDSATGAARPSATKTLTARSASPATATSGTPGDGQPDFQYDPATGDVTFVRDGLDTSKLIQTLTLRSAGHQFITGVGYTSQNNSGVDVDQTDEQFASRFSGIAKAAPFTFDLGDILPKNLTLAQLQGDLSANYDYQGDGATGDGIPAGVTVLGASTPEPAALSLVAVGAGALLARRRRQLKR